MAKFCEVCKHTYPDNLASCPHCTTTADMIEIDQPAPGSPGQPKARPGSDDSSVDLGKLARAGDPGAQPPSQVSSLAVWASLIDDAAAPEAARDADIPVVESQSTVGFAELVEAPEEAPAAEKPAAPTPADKQAEESSAVDLGSLPDVLTVPAPAEAGAEEPPALKMVDSPAAPGPQAARKDDSEVDLLKPSEEEEAFTPDLNLVEATAADAIELGDELEVTEEASEEAMDAEPVESSRVDLGAVGGARTLGGEDSFNIPTDMTDVLREPTQARSGVSPSGVDLGAMSEGEGDMPTDLALGEDEERPKSKPGPVARHESTKLVEELEAMESESMVNLGADPPKGKKVRRDLVAEGLESGINLDRDAPAPASSPSGSSGIEVDSVLEDDIDLSEVRRRESSEVDLGKPFGKEESVLSDEQVVEAVDLQSDMDLDALEAAPISSDSDPKMKKPPALLKGGRLPPDEDVELDAEVEAEADEEIVADEATVTADEDTEPTVSMEGEEAVAEEEVAAGPAAEAEAEEEAEEEEPKPAKKPSRGRGALVGGLAGVLVGGAVCVALMTYEVVPVNGIQELLGAKKTPPAGSNTPPRTQPQPLPAVGVEEEWAKHLHQLRQKGEKPKAEHEQFKKVFDDLKTKSDNDPEALFWLGHAQEEMGDEKAARATYEEGAKKFPEKKQMFEAAKLRLDIREAEKPAGGARLLLPGTGDELRRLVLLLIAADVAAPPDDKKDEKKEEVQEAGAEFWNAVKHAHNHKYEEAIDALKKARATHDKERFAKLRKAQNPLTDPTEEIFLRSCDELLAYWTLRQQLQKSFPKEAPGKAVENLLTAKNQAETDKMAVQGVLEQVNKELASAGIKDNNPASGVKKLADARKTADDKVKLLEPVVTSVAESLTKAKYLSDQQDVAKVAKAVDTLIADKQTAVTNYTKVKEEQDQAAAKLAAAGYKAPKILDDLIKDKQTDSQKLTDINAQIKTVTETLKDAKVKDYTDAVKGTAQLADIAKTQDPTGRLRESLAKNDTLEGQLKLEAWLPILQRRGPKNVKNAQADVDRILQNASGEEKAKALYLQGLIHRHQGKFDQARTAFEQALAEGNKALQGDWRTRATEALAELTKPGDYYLTRLDTLRSSGQYPEAVNLLSEALVVFPKEKGRLLALRSQARLEAARQAAKGAALTTDSPGVAEARKDAQDAVEAGAKAEGSFALGRLAEELSNWSEARQGYESALEAEPASDRFKVALARILHKLHREKTAPAAPAGGVRTGQFPAGTEALAGLVLLLGLEPPPEVGNSSMTPEQKRAIELANEVLKSENADFAAKAQAYAVLGLWTKALTTCVDGLQPNLRREHADLLSYLVKNHPAFKRPDTLGMPNPLLAEQHYATGLRDYWARKYAEAEKAFLASIEHFDQDARYFYFLGLARMAQGKRDDALVDFEQGAKLEQQNLPSRSAVNAALERVQGRTRQTLNAKRDEVDPAKKER